VLQIQQENCSGTELFATSGDVTAQQQPYWFYHVALVTIT